MDHSNESEFSSAPIPFRNHTALLLGAALPYLQPAYRHPVELALKFLEFSETLRLYQEFHMRNNTGSFFFSGSPYHKQDNDSGFFGLLNTFILDLEGLLVSLSSVCTGGEKEVVGMFLNLIRAKNFYDTYGDLLKNQFSDLGDLGGFGGLANLGGLFGTPPVTQDTTSNSTPLSPDLSSMLNNEQKETLELLKSLFSDEL